MEKGVVDAPTGAAMEGAGDDVCVFQAVSFAKFVAFSDLREGYMDQKRRSALEVRWSAVVLVSPESLKELPRILKLLGVGWIG